MASESSRKRLPFEPSSSKGADKGTGKAKQPPKAAAAKKPDTKKSDKPAPAANAGGANQEKTPASRSGAGSSPAGGAMPEEVSRRMLRRMLAFSGTPTVLAILTFFVSYYLVVNQVVELPSYFVLLVTLGLFGLGVVGLTYGVLSASWDEGRPGSLLGLDEFQVNFGRMTSAWGTKSDR